MSSRGPGFSAEATGRESVRQALSSPNKVVASHWTAARSLPPFHRPRWGGGRERGDKNSSRVSSSPAFEKLRS